MSCHRFAVAVVAAFVAVLAAAHSAAAQQADSTPAPYYAGRVGLYPTIRLSNVGWDSNVYNNREAEEVGDFTSSLSPAIDALLRSPRFNLTVHSQWDYYYFRRLASLRALDIDQSGRVEATLNRLSPYVSGNWLSTRHRQNVEVDAMERRRDHSVEAGTYVRVSAKTFVGVSAARAAVDYESDARFRGTELAPVLNRSTTTGTLAVRYQMTPLTTFSVGLTRGATRFPTSRERDADSWQVGPTVEFKPLALISGSASVGFQTVKFRGSTQPDFKSTVMAVDLQYTLRGRTQFGVGATRNLEYSFLDTQVDYVLTGLATTVSHRLNDRWDAGVVASRYGLGYRRREVALAATDVPSSTFMSYGANIGYRLGRHRIGLDVEHQGRTSDIPLNDYERLRVMSSLRYVF